VTRDCRFERNCTVPQCQKEKKWGREQSHVLGIRAVLGKSDGREKAQIKQKEHVKAVA
jgi:hypothetical protein